MDFKRYEIEHYSLCRSAPFKPIKPIKQKGESYAIYGARLDEYKKLMEEFQKGVKKAKETLMKRLVKLKALFKKELIEELGWEWMPSLLFEKVWDYIWEKGHSAGYSEVYNVALDLCVILECVKDFSKEKQNEILG